MVDAEIGNRFEKLLYKMFMVIASFYYTITIKFKKRAIVITIANRVDYLSLHLPYNEIYFF